jgi:uncharacterized protein (DUF1015 family)
MALVVPFRALRPRPADAARVAAVPYDVVSTDEARTLAEGNPLSFLRVSRAEIDLPPGTNPYADEVYARATQNFQALRDRAFVQETHAALYVYRLRMGGHEQTGLAACYAIDDYDSDIIRKHERTRRDKEDDRTRHLLALGAQTGPVFLTYRARPEVDAVVARATAGAALYDFEAPDAVRHTVWLVPPADTAALVSAFAAIPALYIADGHHRAASASRARADIRARGAAGAAATEADTFLAVAFPHDHLQVLAYNRTVKDLNRLAPAAFIEAVRARFRVSPGRPSPERAGEFSMYFQHEWRTLTPVERPDASDPIGSLDVSVLQDRLLSPVLGITDPRTDKRIDFVGGARGTHALQQLVDSGAAAVAFSLYPVSVEDLMRVSDAGAIMPPKSTWFEPKLRDGLLIHTI